LHTPVASRLDFDHKKKLSPRIIATLSLPINFSPNTKASGNPLGLSCSIYVILIPKLFPLGIIFYIDLADLYLQ